MKRIIDGKSSELDKIEAKFLMLDEESVKWLPHNWLRSEFKLCQNLQEHLLKVFLKIIHGSIYRLYE